MKTKKEKFKEIESISRQLQDNCHSTVQAIIENTHKEISYQDATNV